MSDYWSAYVSAVLREAALTTQNVRRPACTLYVGGGTPSVLPAELLEALLGGLLRLFDFPDGAEVTVEANPGTTSEYTLGRLRRAGANRISLGVQSLDPPELEMLGRIHSVSQVRQSVHQAQAAGFDNLNLDLIYGLPGQELPTWTTTLEQAIGLGPEHLSLYALSLEDDTPLAQDVADGRLPAPDPDLAADMYLAADAILSRAGFENYEISNWSRPGRRSAHNQVYWRNQAYLGLGAGAHSSSVDHRWWNVADIPAYIERVSSAVPTGENQDHRPAVEGEESINLPLQMGETMMLGLRLTADGVTFDDFRARFGVEVEAVYGTVIDDLVILGLLERDGQMIRLSRRGRLLGNQVFSRFLP